MKKIFLILGGVILLGGCAHLGVIKEPAEEYCICPEYQYEGNTIISVDNNIVGILRLENNKKKSFSPFVCGRCLQPRKEPSQFEPLEEKRQRLLRMKKYLEEKEMGFILLSRDIENVNSHIADLKTELKVELCEP